MAAAAAKQGPILDLLFIAYGSSASDPDDDSRFCGDDQRRVEVTFNPRVPAEIAGNLRRMRTWVQPVIQSITLDVKHSQQWHCEFCTKLARESSVNVMSWLHLTQPKMNVYVHLMCNTVRGPCARTLKQITAEMVRGGGAPPPTLTPDDFFSGDAHYPAAASCASCNKDATMHKDMFRCSKCKLTRYCSAECQRQDWPRHKVNCKTVKEVKWVWN